jgi:hypothetical protein
MFLLHLHLVHVVFLLHLHLVHLFTNNITWKFVTLTQPWFVGILLSVLAVSLPFAPAHCMGLITFCLFYPERRAWLLLLFLCLTLR